MTVVEPIATHHTQRRLAAPTIHRMTEAPLRDPQITRAVSNIQPRSERQPDLAVLEKTYVDTGVLPQLQNNNNQILYGRRGTGKSHIFRVLGIAHDREVGRASHLYVDVRLLGSAQLMTDATQPLTLRCVSVFRDLLSELQNHLLDVATDSSRDGTGLEQVSQLADALARVTQTVREREVTIESTAGTKSGAHIAAQVGTSGIGISGDLSSGSTGDDRFTERFTEIYRETVIFSEVATRLDDALTALGLDRLLVLIDEWTAIPADYSPTSPSSSNARS